MPHNISTRDMRYIMVWYVLGHLNRYPAAYHSLTSVWLICTNMQKIRHIFQKFTVILRFKNFEIMRKFCIISKEAHLVPSLCPSHQPHFTISQLRWKSEAGEREKWGWWDGKVRGQNMSPCLWCKNVFKKSQQPNLWNKMHLLSLYHIYGAYSL